MSKKQPKLLIVAESASMADIDVNGITQIAGGHIRFDATLQTVDDCNRNKNEYPKQVLSDALMDPRLVELIDRRSWYGEIAHPWDRKNAPRCVDILPAEISHRITKRPWFRGSEVRSTIETCKPRGELIEDWVLNGKSQLGFSMRGITPYTYTKQTPIEHQVVKSPMKVLTYDTVFYPSHKDALYDIHFPTTHEGVSLENVDILTMMKSGKYWRDPEISFENAYTWDEIKNYVTEGSEIFKIFRDELGINFESSQFEITEHNGEKYLSGTLEDGRLAEVNVEDAILAEIATAIHI